MCTVTFLPLTETDFVLTSSRDVGYRRKEALPPATYFENNVSMVYPKDGKAGGTWIGTSRDSRLICLLNGGFQDHDQRDFYARSRGLVVKDLLLAESFTRAIPDFDLKDIEPFTLVVVEWKDSSKLFQFVWDGSKRHLQELEWRPSIWSSSTLYTDEMKAMRLAWFDTWFTTREVTPGNVLSFHRKAGIGNKETDVFMRRDQVGTVSITQVLKNGGNCKMSYFPFSSDQKGYK